VHYNYRGNWTALFCTGDASPVPPRLAAGTYVFKASRGYDGQYYRYVAHNPWARENWAEHFDAPRWRYVRIFVPALSWLLAAGQARWIDAAYIAVVLLSVFFGTYWLGRYAADLGRNPAWGLSFLLLPATLISLDRLTVDVALAALCVAFVWYARRNSTAGLYAALTAAALTRETGLLLTATACGWYLWNRQWRRSLLLATTIVPALAWFAYVLTHVADVPGRLEQVPRWVSGARPLSGLVAALSTPLPYAFPAPLLQIVQVLDAVALCGFLLALIIAVRNLWRRKPGLEGWAAVPFVVLALAVRGRAFWFNVYEYSRPFNPLFLLVGTGALSGAGGWVLLPIALMDLRIAAQLAPQALGIVRGLF